LHRTLGGSHGVPLVHYKGRQGDYYVMVCYCWLLLPGSRLLGLYSLFSPGFRIVSNRKL
jgi:hypothetical protein